MRNLKTNVALALSLAIAGSSALLAQEIPMEGPAPATALVRAETKNNARLDPGMLKLEVNGHLTPIDSISPVRPGSAQIAILIDDGLRGSFGNQISDLQRFIRELPAGAQVLVGYMQNGTVRSSGQFSRSHEEVAGQLRIPLSSAGISASPYFCLSEFVKHWPSQQPGPRFVLMLTNGVDPYNGSVSPMNQNSPYVQTAQDDAQRAGVAVYSIYYGDRGMGGQLAGFSGQNYLQQVSEATGGEAFNQLTSAPPSIGPYLSSFRRALAESYNIGFRAGRAREHGGLVRLKVRTSQSGVKVHAPDGVRSGGNQY